MGIVCASCGSQQVQRVAMAHAQNTSVMYSGRGKAAGVQQTVAGVMMKPPRKRRMAWRWGLFLLLLMGTLSGLLQVVQAAFSGATALVITMVGEIFYIVITYALWHFGIRRGQKYNRDVFKADMARWERLWVCNQCGSVFEPESQSSNTTN